MTGSRPQPGSIAAGTTRLTAEKASVAPLMSRFLVVSASMGEGHDGAARELVRRLEAQGHQARMVDALDAAPLRLGSLSRSSYELQLRWAPWSYELTYRLWSLLPVLCWAFTALLTRLTRRRLLQWIEQYQPDVIVTTYGLSSIVLGRLRRRRRITVPTVTFVTDFAVHPLWVHRGNDLTLCVHPQAAAMAARRTGRPTGAPGPMVADRFRGERPDRETARAELGLGPNDKAVLVVAGSWGVGEIDNTFDALAGCEDYIPIAVCGRNEALRAALAERPGGRAIGWTDQMPSLMVACDALVHNAGGLTCMEAFAIGLPVVTYLPIPGHGRDNGDLMERAGVAAYARRPEDLLAALDRVTTLAGRRQVEAGRAMFNGDAADEVAALVAPAPLPVAVRARRRAPRTRAAAAVAVGLAAVWSTFTIGVGAAAAHGIGMARPERSSDEVFVGVRLGPNSIADPALPGRLADARVTAIVGGSLAKNDPDDVRRLADAGVDLANGGWGRHGGRTWSRARSDLLQSCHWLQSAGQLPCHAFVPGRRLDGFDVATARVSHQRIVAHVTLLSPDHPPAHLRAGGMYVLDARDLDAAAITRVIDDLQPALATDVLNVVSFADLR